MFDEKKLTEMVQDLKVVESADNIDTITSHVFYDKQYNSLIDKTIENDKTSEHYDEEMTFYSIKVKTARLLQTDILIYLRETI